MNVADTLCRLARGDVTAARAVLHNCPTAAFGTTAYGREDTAALFRAIPLDLDAEAAVVTETVAALFGRDGDGEEAALFADLYDGQVGRLWALAARRQPSPRLDETALPIDLDLDQRGGTLDVATADHPALDSDGAAALRRLGQAWIDGQPGEIVGPLARARPVMLRAASAGGRTAALLMIQGLAQTSGIARFAVGVLIGDGARVTIDIAGRAAAIARHRVVELRPRDTIGADAPN